MHIFEVNTPTWVLTRGKLVNNIFTTIRPWKYVTTPSFLEGQTSKPLKLLLAYFSCYKLAFYIEATTYRNIFAWTLISLAVMQRIV